MLFTNPDKIGLHAMTPLEQRCKHTSTAWSINYMGNRWW